MLPELAYFALILALALNLIQILLPFINQFVQKYPKNEKPKETKEIILKTTRPIALTQSLLVLISYLLLTYAFVNNDFSVEYIARHSNTSLPLFYKISAVWSGHEGSLLLWLVLLGFWTTAVVVSSRKLSLDFVAGVLVVIAIVSAGFLLFLLLTSNPFIRLLPDYPLNGRDLNPLLQDPGLIIHPPLLYLGYVGFTVPFAFAIASLWRGEMQSSWVQWIRPFVLIAWSFLTIGIALGSWWAYYELGWGGWWFWDPVENASFIPWLTGTALVHSLIIASKRNQFLGWTTFLAIITFAFCLLATFLVRSGILTSVHSFANDPKRSLFLLQFVSLVIGAALIFYAIRVRKLSLSFPVHLYSRESLIVFNSALFLVAALSILLGTVFPIFYEMLTQEKISVGFPYFNSIFVPLMIPILCSVPLGPFTKWGENYPFFIINQLKWTLLLSVLVAALLPWWLMNTTSFSVILGVALGLWVGFGTLQRMFHKIKNGGKGGGLKNISLGGWGMILGHMGAAVVVIGVTIVSNYSIEKEVQVVVGQPLLIDDYRVTLQEINPIEGSNYVGHQGRFSVEKLDREKEREEGTKQETKEETKIGTNEEMQERAKEGKIIATLLPEKRLFVVPGLMMTETAIDAGFFRDIYISLGEKLGLGSFSARIYYKPLVRWIWLGALMIAFGAVLSAFHRKKIKS